MGKEGQTVPEMTEEYVNSVSERYIELYEHITGEKFTRSESDDINARIIAEKPFDCKGFPFVSIYFFNIFLL